MENIKVVSADTEQEIWPEIEAVLLSGEVYDYNITVNQGGREIELYMDIDLGGGFEGGSEFTTLKAPLNITDDFRFAIHDEDFMDAIGKFFGMQDVEIGYPDLDKHLIIKTNNEDKVKHIFSDALVREVFATLESFDCGIHLRDVDDGEAEQPFLELNINEGINESGPLRRIYHAFYSLVTAIENMS